MKQGWLDSELRGEAHCVRSMVVQMRARERQEAKETENHPLPANQWEIKSVRARKNHPS